ncbi:hypothetical protein DL770_001879 [Monosporascus sp. CRB-9-2]|nr:hypothetical protein DL770_001879 [Monosporascus sp. CRB-9-2]
MSFAAVNRAIRAVVPACIDFGPSDNVISALIHGMRSLRGKRVYTMGLPNEYEVPSAHTRRKKGKEGMTAGKRKLAELLGDKGDERESSATKRKIKHPAKPISPKKITACYGAIRTKITVATLKSTMSKMSVTTKSALTAKSANPSTRTHR